MDLNPAGALQSIAFGASGANQVGSAFVGGANHAGLWSGTAASWVDLHPAGSTRSIAYGASGANQAGVADVAGVRRASLWSGTAGSWVDLQAVLPADFKSSVATSYATDGVTNYISGYGFNTVTGRNEALVWQQPVPEPATMAVLGLGCLALLRRRRKVVA